MTMPYRVKINKGDQIFEVEGDKKFVLEMLKRFEGLPRKEDDSKKSKVLKKQSSNFESSSSSKDLSVGEFIRTLDIKKHTDIVVALGYYLEKHSNKSNFGSVRFSVSG